VEGTKKAFEELNGVLDELAATVVRTLDQVVPCLAKMQSLLSQRGADRKKVLQRAGLPGWTHWAKAYAGRLDRSLRTVQDRIRQFQGKQAGGIASPADKTKGGSNGERLKLDSRQQGALVKAQLAANDLVATLENDGDWQAALATYRKVSVSPDKLDSFVNALNLEPNWKGILAKLANTLEHCVGELPAPAMNALRAVQKLLDGKPDQQQAPPRKPKAAVTKQSHVQRNRKGSACCAVAGEEMRSGDAQKHPASPKVTVCPPALSPEEEERKHGMLGAASSRPGRRQGNFVLKKNGIWECEPEPGMNEAEQILDAQPGEQQVPPSKPMATVTKPFRVKKRIKGDITDFAVTRDGDKLPDEVFDSKGEAKATCESLNKSLVANVMPPHTDPQLAGQSAA
jgi:hypothetical protein